MSVTWTRPTGYTSSLRKPLDPDASITRLREEMRTGCLNAACGPPAWAAVGSGCGWSIGFGPFRTDADSDTQLPNDRGFPVRNLQSG